MLTRKKSGLKGFKCVSLAGLPQAQNMFLPSLSLHLKANSRQQLPVQREGSAPDDDDESQTHDNSVLENLEDKQSDGVIAANCSSMYEDVYYGGFYRSICPLTVFFCISFC